MYIVSLYNVHSKVAEILQKLESTQGDQQSVMNETDTAHYKLLNNWELSI